MKVCSVNEMRDLDATATAEYGIPPFILMENAGLAAVQLIHQLWDTSPKKILIFCGSGNNGGDGFVVARKLYSYGHRVFVFLLSDEGKISGTARQAYETIIRLPITIYRDFNQADLHHHLSHCQLIVDAILGTGLERTVSGSYRQIIEAINESRKPVLSLDIPSGIHGDTGEVLGAAVRAEATITFGLPKLGNLLYPGYAHGGKLFVSHISFPPQLYQQDTIAASLNIPITLPPRNEMGHKNSFGRLLCIGGSANYYGAPVFSCRAFLKAGGGYARLAAPRSIIPFLAVKSSEVVFHPQKETDSGSLAYSNKDKLLDLAQLADVLVIGPGLSSEAETQECALYLCAEVNKPIIIDGDGITAISKQPSILQTRSAPTILTPHLGEMARLCKLETAQIEKDKINILIQAAASLKAYIVLKGAHSLIAYPDGKLYINMSGNDGMATAGSGDVLTGIIAAMIGLGLPPSEALRIGVAVHGAAGDLAAQVIGKDGMTAEDILAYTPSAMKMIRENPINDISFLGINVI